MRPRFSALFFVSSFLWVCPDFTQADSVLNFPRLSFETGRLVGVAIANPTGQIAVLTATAYGEDGTPLAGSDFKNPVEVILPPGRQYARLTFEIFGPLPNQNQAAWFQVTSPVDGLTGFFLYLDNSVTQLDGADLPYIGGKLIFNRVQIGAGFSTEIDLINPHESANANVNLTLFSPDGSQLFQFVSIPSRGIARLDVATLFQISQAAAGSYILVNSQVPVGGFQLIRKDQSDLLALNAKSANEQLKVIFFPQLAVLGPWKTEVGIVNYSGAAQIITLTAYKPDGHPFGPADLQNNPVIRNLNPNGSLQEDVASLFGFHGTNVLDGWIKVEATSSSINGYISYGTPSTGSVATVAGTAEGRTRALFSHIATTLGYFTGVAVLNPSSLPVNIRIVALRPSGEMIGSYDGVLRPGQRISKLIDELIPEANGQGGGLIWIKSDGPVFLTSIFGTATVLANVPPQQVAHAFQPDQNQPALKVVPPLAIVQPGKSQAFQVQNGGSLTWKVDGVPGGNSVLGTIDNQGNYTAPAAVPSELPVTITAEDANKAAAASVDILTKESLVQNLGIVQSIAYLGSLQKLFVAELTALGSFEAGPMDSGPAADDSHIFQVAPDLKIPLVSFPGETISRMIPFTPGPGADYLLVAAKSSGRILRVHAGTKAVKQIATGLDQPSALVIDPAGGDLLVAEQSQISRIARYDILDAPANPSALSGMAGTAADKPSTKPEILLAADAPISGLAVDACSGQIYYTEGNSLKVFDRSTGITETLLSDLIAPGQLLAIYRSGVSCPNALQILIIESAASRVALFTPADGNLTTWAVGEGLTDIISLPEENPFDLGTSILLAEFSSGSGRVSRVETGDLYASEAPNTPVLHPIGDYSDPIGDAIGFGEVLFPADIVSLSAYIVGSNLELTISFAEPITPPSEEQTSDFFNSYTYLDLDPGESSGFDLNENGMFIDGIVVLLPDNQALVATYEFQGEMIVQVGIEVVPVTYSERSYTVVVPMSVLGNRSRLGFSTVAFSGSETGFSFDMAPDNSLLVNGSKSPNF